MRVRVVLAVDFQRHRVEEIGHSRRDIRDGWRGQTVHAEHLPLVSNHTRSGKILPARVVILTVESLNTNVFQGDARSIGYQLLFDKPGKQHARCVAFHAQCQNIGVPIKIAAQPFETVVVVGGHVIIEIQAFGNFGVLEPRKNVNSTIADSRDDPGII